MNNKYKKKKLLTTLVGLTMLCGVAIPIGIKVAEKIKPSKDYLEEQIDSYVITREYLKVYHDKLYNKTYLLPEYAHGINAAHYDRNYILGGDYNYMNPESIKILEELKESIDETQEKINKLADKYNKTISKEK
jgi:hypothetical protein